jgi:peptidylprolyl isomerase
VGFTNLPEEGLSQAKEGDTVLIEYCGTLSDGTIFDSNVGKKPFQFVLGQGQVITGFETAVMGMKPGEVKNVTIAAAEAYGPYCAEKVITIQRESLPPDITPNVGEQLVMQNGSDSLVVTVTAITDCDITLDTNSPLAGKDLTFDLRLLEIK